jgi:excinuclease ABC subunit A
MEDKIIIKGAKENNLKNVSLEIPKNKMVVFTGVSGSGKSSLAFDTIFAEGQRRYIESLSSYARQFLGQKNKPDVESIEGLSPAVAIDQKAASHNPRSTVATITEIYDYLRVLFARIGQPYCPNCGEKIEKMSIDQIIDFIQTAVAESKINEIKNNIKILAPVIEGRKGEYHQLLYDLYLEGFQQAYIDGKLRDLSERINLGKFVQHKIEVVIDEFNPNEELPMTRLTEAVELALDKGKDVINVIFPDDSRRTISSRFTCPNCHSSFTEIEPRLFSFNSPYGACPHCHGLGTEYFWSKDPCPVCLGKRLRKEALSVKIDDKNIADITSLTVEGSLEFFKNIKLNKQQENIAQRVLLEVVNRLQFLFDVGLNYLTLNRRAETLSGGEAQRIRLASQIGSQLTGVLYVLDEPTIGLHQRDNERLIATLINLRDIGNSVIVVEHDEDTIFASDYIVDIGPGAGRHGGEIIVSDELDKALVSGSKSETIQYLVGEKKIEIPTKRRKGSGNFLAIVGAQENNLKKVNVNIPLKTLTVVTGVSGSGKSTLVEDILSKALAERLNGSNVKPGKHNRIEGLEHIDKLVVVDQSPIGRTPRSNPATYTGIFTLIRDLFASLPEANRRGYKPGRFSFNVPTSNGGGRCEVCQGDGYKKIEMLFLPDVYVECEVCRGKRFSRETLEVKYKGKSISDVLSMTVEEAYDFFENISRISDRLKMLKEVGLDYISLGQSAPTLSGGEAQRIKLSTELIKRQTGRTLYILDEPTVGLHFSDVKKLLEVLQRLVSLGNTIVVIEHNLDVIKQADWIIDLGPEGGDKGGTVIATGTPEDIAQVEKSYTGQWLKKIFKNAR